jgi:prevent-host-death family protein
MSEEAQNRIMINQPLNLYEAKTQLSSLVDRAAAGEEIIIAKAGKPMARLVPLEAKKRPSLRELAGQNIGGLTYMAPDFNDEDEEFNDLFYKGLVSSEDE